MSQDERIKKIEKLLFVKTKNPYLIVRYGDENEVGIFHPEKPNEKFSFESIEELDNKIKELELINEVTYIHYLRGDDDDTTN